MFGQKALTMSGYGVFSVFERRTTLVFEHNVVEALGCSFVVTPEGTREPRNRMSGYM